MIRATRRMIERIGLDMDSGLHITEVPRVSDKEPVILEDSKLSFLNSLVFQGLTGQG